MTDEPNGAAVTSDAAAPASTGDQAVPPQYGVGPFSVRELTLVGIWVVAFVVSFFSISPLQPISVWTRGIDWILPVGVPTAAVFLLVLRRLSPTGIRRVGSLGIDQFASVAFSVAAVVWLAQLWLQLAIVVAGGPLISTWVSWVSFVLMLGGVALTVFAPFIPVMCDDFAGRPPAPAHRNARPVRALTARPAPVRAAAPAPAPSPVPAPDAAATAESDPDVLFAANRGADAVDGADAATDAGAATNAGAAIDADAGALTDGDAVTDADDAAAHGDDATAQDADAGPSGRDADGQRVQPVEASSEATSSAARQAFWTLVPEERDVVDADGTPVFRIGPTAWALVIEDRGDSFVVRDEDGTTGVLRDVSGVQRG